MRLLSSHSKVHIDILTADRSAGQEFKRIYPQFSYNNDLPLLSKWEDSQSQIEASDVVFCCLPHGTTQEIISILAKSSSAKIIDLSADFRLKDTQSYAKWYGKEHAAPELQKEAVYGLSEVINLVISIKAYNSYILLIIFLIHPFMYQSIISNHYSNNHTAI